MEGELWDEGVDPNEMSQSAQELMSGVVGRQSAQIDEWGCGKSERIDNGLGGKVCERVCLDSLD